MSPLRLAKVESAIRVVLEFKECFSRHDVDGMMDLMSDDPVFESMAPNPEGTLYTGKEAIKGYWKEFFLGSPNARIEVEEVFSSATRCVVRWRYLRGDAHGSAGGLRGVDVFKVLDNRICEQLSYVKGCSEAG
jgi:ketosteroid isomerase-like protein